MKILGAFEGAFVGYKDADAAVAIFAMPDQSRVELPVAALTEASRSRLKTPTEPAATGESVTARGPFGQSVALAVPAMLKAVETDAIWCATADEGLRVYDLFLAGDSLSEQERAAAQERRKVWLERARVGRVRLGNEWVTKQEFEAAIAESRSLVQSALQSFRLEDAKRAESELEKASRRNPEDGTPEFVLGLAYWLHEGPSANAVEHFSAAARRSPNDPYVLNNLLVCDVQAGRYGSVAERFTRVLNLAPTSQPCADNLGLAVFGATSRKPKMPERLVDRLLDVYRKACQDLKLAPIESAAGRKFTILSPEGKACRSGPLSTLPLMLEPPREWLVRARYGSAVGVSSNLLLTNRSLVVNATELFVQIPGEAGGRFAATEVAWLDDCDVSLLRCDRDVKQSLPVADRGRSTGDEVTAFFTEDGMLSPLKAEKAPGCVVPSPAGVAKGHFFHSAVLPRGPGGGPIVDRKGMLVGLVAATPRTDQIGNTKGCGIPIELIWPLLKEHASDVQAGAGEPEATAPEVIAARAAEATVRVIALEKRVKPK